MRILIKATNIELTPEIKKYTEEKISSLDRYFNNIIEAKVEIGINSARHQKGEIFFCEVNIAVPNRLLRVKKTEKKLLKAIDKTKDHLRVMLHRYKEKLKGRPRKENEKMKNIPENFDDLE